jgi:hypothetical protein
MRRGKALSNVAWGLLATLLGILLVFVTFFSHAQAAESSYTQANGIRENATVTHVDTEQSHSQYGGYAATYLTVTLPTPVSGRTSTVVNLSRIANYTDGQVVAVLVNPRDPGYAELPGQPNAVGFQTVAAGLVAVLMLVSGVAMTIGGVRTGLRLRRTSRNAMSAAAGSSGASSGM